MASSSSSVLVKHRTPLSVSSQTCRYLKLPSFRLDMMRGWKDLIESYLFSVVKIEQFPRLSLSLSLPRPSSSSFLIKTFVPLKSPDPIVSGVPNRKRGNSGLVINGFIAGGEMLKIDPSFLSLPLSSPLARSLRLTRPLSHFLGSQGLSGNARD